MNKFQRPTMLAIAALSLSSVAFADRVSTVVTDQRFASNASAETIDGLVADGFRMHDIDITSASPLKITGSFVRNTGTYAKAWWWTADKTFAQLDAFAHDRNARPIDIETYVVNGQRRFAATFIHNTGADNVAWQMFDNVSFETLKAATTSYNGRIIDLDVRQSGQDRRYSGVMIKNTGSFAKQWAFFGNQTGQEVEDLIADRKMQLVDLERIEGGKYAGVLQKNDAAWWWKVGQTWEQLQLDVSQFGARVADIDRYDSGNGIRYNYILLNNSNALETRIGNLLRSSADGARGFYLRQVGVGTLGDLMADYHFYPASTIKTVEHAYWSYRVQNGLLSTTPTKIYTNHTLDTHPVNAGSFFQSLQLTQQNMMWNSSNQDTNALQDAAGNGDGVTGRAVINSFKTSILDIDGDVKLNHKFGALGPASPVPNTATLREYGKLYEVLTNGSIFNLNGYAYFRSNMLNETRNTGLTGGLRTIVTQEGMALGMTGAERTAFFNAMRFVWKPGNFNGTTYISSAGEIELPAKGGNGQTQIRRYVVGAFADNVSQTTFTTGSMSSTVLPEIMRGEINKAMATW